MVNIPLSRSDYFRGVAKEARIRTKNRYFEQNPVLNNNQSALIARPGMKRWLSIGEGPIRATYSQPGSFDDALFVASGGNLYRVETGGTPTFIGALPSVSLTASVSMAATSNIGATPAFLFVCAGSTLMCYVEDGYAFGTVSGAPVSNDVIVVGTTYYRFTNASVDAGTPAGTNANPWLVALGASTADAWQNFGDAIGARGTGGTSYSILLTANAFVNMQAITSTAVVVRAQTAGATGNGIVTTETGAAIAWTGGTLSGGGAAAWFAVAVPDDVGAISLGYIDSHVVVIPVQVEGIKGRFYWIDPGETVIDPLDFATAERAPDPLSDVVVFGDQFWLPGSNTTEVWYFTGNDDSPVARMQGIMFDRGAWEGTAIQVEDSMIIVGNEGAVFQVGGGLKRISRPDIEERIRSAIQYQASQE